MVTFIIEAIIVASFTAWLLTLLDKWGVIEWCECHAPNDLLAQLLRCDYCKCWWLGVLTSVVLAICLADGWVLLVPFVSTKIAQLLYRQ